VCVVGGWFKQPPTKLARVKLIRLWCWVRLHTRGALANQCTQDKPAITTDTQESAHSILLHLLCLQNLTTLPVYSATFCVLVSEELSKSHFIGLWQGWLAADRNITRLKPNKTLLRRKRQQYTNHCCYRQTNWVEPGPVKQSGKHAVWGGGGDGHWSHYLLNLRETCCWSVMP